MVATRSASPPTHFTDMNGHATSPRGRRYDDEQEEDEKTTFLPSSLSDLEQASNHSHPTFACKSPSHDHHNHQCPSHAHHRENQPSISHLLHRTALFLLPSFLHPPPNPPTPRPPPPYPFLPTPRTITTPASNPTAYLDGIRGLAALHVFFCHLLYTSFAIAPGYGAGGAHRHVFLLPFLRLLFSGPPMVCVFFVVSGYALSLKPLRLAHQKQWARWGEAVGSLVFRRAIRLYLPTAVSTAVVVVLVRVRMYEWTRGFAEGEGGLVRNVLETHYGRANSTAEQVGEWAGAMVGFVHVWDWEPFGGSTRIDVHLWTIPVEFRCSMMVFLTLVGTARLGRGWRGCVVGGLVAFAYVSQRWEMVLFYAGMALAEVDVARGAHERGKGEGGGDGMAAGGLPAPGIMSAPSSRSSSPSSSPPARRRAAKQYGWAALSVVGLYFMSQPDERGAETPGWVFLTSLIPAWWNDEHRYWQSIGAALFVLAVSRSPGWQRFFTLGVVQYFGRISYALYLMHGPVMHTVGYAIERWAWGVTGSEGRAYEAGFALACVFAVPIVIWVSDVFWRAVDAPVVRFARWFEAQCSISE